VRLLRRRFARGLWIALQVQAGRRRNLLEWTTDLRRLDAAEFEWLVGELFRREGWKVAEGSQDRPDGGIDLVLTRGRERAIVQCKRWTSWQVGVEDVRSFAGVLAREGLGAKGGVFVTLSGFTEQARTEVKQLGLSLLDGIDLYARGRKGATARGVPELRCADDARPIATRLVVPVRQ
jgi:restriction system protein